MYANRITKVQFLALSLCRVTNGKLQTNVFIPGLRVQYTTDDGKTWSDVSDEVVVTSTIKLGTRWVRLEISDVK